jgi:uncharacterized phage-associated protein
MAISAHDVAAVIRRELPNVPAVKLHKLLYYCQGHHLAAFDEPLFSEPIAAWDMGPVVPTFRYEDGTPLAPEGYARLNEAQLNTIGYVVSHYGKLTSRELVNMTHSEDPWLRADAERPKPKGSAPIRQEWMKEFFKAAEATDREDDMPFDPAQVAEIAVAAVERSKARSENPAVIDEPADVLAWINR